jgi:acyl-CoA synthetase (AMP-forming)/AMP-acid ligase II
MHVSAIIACAEMGLKIILLDSPATEESLPYTKLALHGPSDFYLHFSHEGDGVYGGLHGEMMRRYGGQSIDAVKLPEMSTEDTTFNYEISPDDPLLMSSTSGTTKPSRPVYFSHREVMTISRRNVDIFKFDENSKVVHSRNLHHASAMLTSLIPSLMVANRHLTLPISHDTNLDVNGANESSWQMIYNDEFTHVMIANEKSLRLFLDKFDKPFKKPLNINMCGFTLNETFVDLAREYNVKFHSHYGSIDTAIPLLINFVDEDSVVKENGLGVLADDFYQFDGKEIRCELWDEPRYIEDTLYLIDGHFFIEPRELPEVPDDVDLEPFFQDTKINFEQLRGYLNERNKS